MTPWESGRLTAEHQTDDFRCGNEALDRWLRNEALRAENAGVSATVVWTPPGEPTVVAFYSIAPTVLRREELPSRSMAGGYSFIPGYLIGRLALHVSMHGKGLGAQLLIDALEFAVSAADHGAGRVIVVDAIDDAAASFYRHHHFIEVPGTRRLVMKVATARAAVRGTGPGQ